MKKALAIGVMAASIMSSFASSTPAYSAGEELTFSHYQTHPRASKTGYDYTSKNYYKGTRLCSPVGENGQNIDHDGDGFCPVGQTLTDMNIDKDGNLVAGYGDWNSNVGSFGVADGGVGAMPLDLNTNTWGEFYPSGSEAMDIVRNFDGALYIPTTDPSDRAAYENKRGTGYLTNEGGVWRFNQSNIYQVHTLDVLKRADGSIYLFGAEDWGPGGSTGAARVQKSTDGGATFRNVLSRESAEGTSQGYERFYWGSEAGGKIWTRAAGVNGVVTYLDGSSDGESWNPNKKVNINIRTTKYVESFQNNMVYADSFGYVKTFNGKKVAEKPLPNSARAIDFHKADDGFLYVLSRNGEVFRLKNLSSDWEFLTKHDGDPVYSLAVYKDHIYLGGENGKIYKSNTSIEGSVPAAPEDKDVATNPRYKVYSGYPATETFAPGVVTIDSGVVEATIEGANFNTVNRVHFSYEIGAGVYGTSSVEAEIVNKTDTSITIRINTDALDVPYKTKNGRPNGKRNYLTGDLLGSIAYHFTTESGSESYYDQGNWITVRIP